MSEAAYKNPGSSNVDLTLLQGGQSEVVMEQINRVQSIVELDSNGKILSVNAVFAKMVGYGEDELIGKNYKSFFVEGFADTEEFAAFWQKVKAGEPATIEEPLLTKAGRKVYLLSHFTYLSGTEDGQNKIFMLGMDVSKTHVELEVRKDIMNLTSIVSEGNLRGDILNVNEKFCEVSQYTREELLGKPHNTTRHPDMPKEVFKQMWATIGRGQVFRGVVKNRKKDGNPYYVDAVIAPLIGENGKPKKYLGVRYDITDLEIERQNMKGVLGAIDSSYAFIEFDLDGRVMKANQNFLTTTGYEEKEIVGQHHRMFCEKEYASSTAYQNFWAELKEGKSKSDVFKRIRKDGKEVWIQAIYSPVKDEMGRVQKYIKIATDITQQKLEANDNAGQLAAIGRAQAVIEFKLDGSVIKANDNFLKTLGYDLSEIQGKHHSLFCEKQYSATNEYRDFWARLNAGEFQAGEYKRLGKGGKVVWINASYTPILDANGRPYKVVKFATDITHVKNMISSIEETANVLAAASNELTATATQMTNTAEQTNKESTHASAIIDQVASGVQVVATNIEEMASSIREISRSTTESSEIAKNALKRAQETNTTITQLGVSSEEIGDVIKVISSIAQQTNLLALNATIEAARAGEAGRGFAVVANEVKELAKQTAKATHEITNKIGAIQKDTQGAVDAIGGISQVIEKLNGISGVIAAAVEEQSSAAGEVSRVVLESKKGVESINSTIKLVSQASTESADSSKRTLEASTELSKLAEKLTTLVK